MRYSLRHIRGLVESYKIDEHRLRAWSKRAHMHIMVPQPIAIRTAR